MSLLKIIDQVTFVLNKLEKDILGIHGIAIVVFNDEFPLFESLFYLLGIKLFVKFSLNSHETLCCVKSKITGDAKNNELALLSGTLFMECGKYLRI